MTRSKFLLSILFFVLSISSKIFAQCMYNEIEITTSTLQWGDEVSWELYSTESETLIESYTGTTDSSSFTQSVCIDDGCYYFVAMDTYGDGWNGTVIESEDIFDSSQTLSNGFYGFFTFSIGEDNCNFELTGCTNSESFNYIQGATDDDGSCEMIESYSFTGNGNTYNREYIYYAPANLEPGSPLVFVLHGYFGWATEMYEFSGFKELADEAGFGVVFPQGSPDGNGNNHWNANFDWGSEPDLEFLVLLAKHLQSEYNHSTSCTYSCGYSNGGYMSYSLACNASETFRGVGSVGGTMTNNDWDDCQPTQQVPVIHLHGTSDETILYEGTTNWQFGWGQQPGVETIVQSWAQRYNCTSYEEIELPNTVLTDGSDVDLIRHYDGDGGYEARLYRVNNGGHDWFGAFGNFDIQSSVEIWNFWNAACQDLSTTNLEDVTSDNIISCENNQIKALQNCVVSVFDINGREILKRPLISGQSIYDFAETGIYLVVANNNELFQSSKILIP